MRRKQGELLPLERCIIHSAQTLANQGQPVFYGYEIAGRVDQRKAHNGTIYRALARLERMGLLVSSWEGAGIGDSPTGPRRKFYRLLGIGDECSR